MNLLDKEITGRGYGPPLSDRQIELFFRQWRAAIDKQWQAFVAAVLSKDMLPVQTVLRNLAGMFAAHAPPSFG